MNRIASYYSAIAFAFATTALQGDIQPVTKAQKEKPAEAKSAESAGEKEAKLPPTKIVPKEDFSEPNPAPEPAPRVLERGSIPVPPPLASKKEAQPENQRYSDLPAMNDLVLRAIQTIPDGGGYATSRKAIDALKSGLALDEKSGGFKIQPDKITPSFCSGATYLVFTKVLMHLSAARKILITPEAYKAYTELGLPDGTGIWGRWNANGPGTAKLFAEIGCGSNFSDIERALPGDFMKIWWNNEIGSKESGHSVIYLGRSKGNDGERIRFWSSNIPGGYGEKTVPKSTVKRVLFSRLDKPLLLSDIKKLPRTNEFLSSMLKRPATWEEVIRECKVDDKQTKPPQSLNQASDKPAVPPRAVAVPEQ